MYDPTGIKLVNSEIGYGLYATEDIPVGAVILRDVARPVDAEGAANAFEGFSKIFQYVFLGLHKEVNCWLVLGTSSLLNNSDTPNVELLWSTREDGLTFLNILATSAISEGDEITHTYGGGGNEVAHEDVRLL